MQGNERVGEGGRKGRQSINRQTCFSRRTIYTRGTGPLTGSAALTRPHCSPGGWEFLDLLIWVGKSCWGLGGVWKVLGATGSPKDMANPILIVSYWDSFSRWFSVVWSWPLKLSQGSCHVQLCEVKMCDLLCDFVCSGLCFNCIPCLLCLSTSARSGEE